MGFFGVWILLALLVAAIGNNRRIGFGLTFLVALIFSPLVGLIAALLSKPKPTAADLALEQMQAAAVANAEGSTVDRLERLAKLRADGALTAEEFEQEKAKVLAKAPSSTKAYTPPPKPSTGEVHDIPLR